MRTNMKMKKQSIIRREKRVRNKIIKGVYRLSISRSSKNLFAQIVDTKTGKTILGLLDKKVLLEIEGKTKTEKAKLFGLEFGKQALAKKIKEVVFDRGSCRYHGRVRAFAEGAREGGLKI